LDAATPAGTPVWLADDAQAGPRGVALVERWLQRTRLRAEYTRRPQPVGPVAHLQQMLAACGDADVVVLSPDAQPLPGWLAQLAACLARDASIAVTRRPQPVGPVAHLQQMLAACGDADVVVLSPDAQPLPGWLAQLAACLARDASIATATPWCNAGEVASWPRMGEVTPLPAEPALTGQACAAMPPRHPELPTAVDHAVALRGSARQRAGGLDTASFGSWYGALADLSLRLAGLGWRNALCETAFVARGGEGGAAAGDLDVLAARWPAWQARLADFLMR